MKIIICTENRAKIQAIKEVCTGLWSDSEFVEGKFLSGVSEQPLSEEEGIEGAIGRAQNGRARYPDADYFFGLEGYVDTNKYGMFLAGAAAIIDKEGTIGIGMSARMRLPEVLRKKVEEGAELGPFLKELVHDEGNIIRHRDGTMGVLTKGLYNRVDEFRDATKCALARFRSPDFFIDE